MLLEIRIMEWETIKDEVGYFHILKVTDDAYVKVEKTRAGDYSITALTNESCAGGEVEYRANLPRAKAFAESIVKDGSWILYLD